MPAETRPVGLTAFLDKFECAKVTIANGCDCRTQEASEEATPAGCMPSVPPNLQAHLRRWQKLIINPEIRTKTVEQRCLRTFRGTEELKEASSIRPNGCCHILHLLAVPDFDGVIGSLRAAFGHSKLCTGRSAELTLRVLV